jgi:hypothetical protein
VCGYAAAARTDRAARQGQGAGAPTEVSDLHSLLISGQQQVLQLDIPVRDAFRVAVGQAHEDLAEVRADGALLYPMQTPRPPTQTVV